MSIIRFSKHPQLQGRRSSRIVTVKLAERTLLASRWLEVYSNKVHGDLYSGKIMKTVVAEKQHSENLIEKPRVDLVLFSSSGEGLQVLLKKREGGTYEGQWGLPGGVINIHKDQSLDDTIKRVCRLFFQRQLPNLHQACTVGSKSRDPRLEWSLTVVHVGWLPADFFDLEMMDRQHLRWWNAASMSTDVQLFLDHDDLLKRAFNIGIKHFRDLMEDMRFPIGLVPGEFTLPELHEMCQVFTQSKIDLLTFRRRIESAGCVVPMEGKFRPSIRRPAQLYKWRTDKVASANQ
jgi:ADP-ribose pyrophosphatase YjhB (NUDIX family)